MEPSGGQTLTVTGAYTGKDRRDGDLPNPVGLFIDNGKVINPTLARMDGVLLIDADVLSLQHRERVAIGGARYALGDPAARRAFAERAADAGLSVAQSHLVIVEGALDARPVEDAPVAVRRLLFTDAHGYGVYQSPEAMTLFDGAEALKAELAPEMALNLDMGSYDYCVATEGYSLTNCGVLGVDDTGRLSNLLRFSLQ